MLGIRIATTGAAFFGVLAMTNAASADHNQSRVGIGIDRHGFHLNVDRGHRGHRGHFNRAPRRNGHYEKIWVPPVYRTVHEYLPCGTPSYRQVVVRRGYYKKIWVEGRSRNFRHGRGHRDGGRPRFNDGRQFDRHDDSIGFNRGFRSGRPDGANPRFRGGRRVDVEEVLDKIEDIVDELD
jgi:hypothetical protein